MGNFEKLSVLVIVVIIVMILVVALYTWTDDPASKEVATQPPENALDLPDTRDAGGTTGSAGTGPWSPWPDPFRAEPASGEEPSSSVVTPEPTPIGSGSETPGTETPASEPPAEEPPAEAPVTSQERTYVVKPGDSYGLIAQRELGSYRHWPAIQELNGIAPEKLRTGVTIRLPAVGTLGAGGGSSPSSSASTPASGPGPKPGTTYTLRSGEDLFIVAKRAYGSRDRWMDIWTANLQKLDDPSDAREGVSLVLPPR
ncbi:MAG: LysM peptidoglycan-binding domain-containing protein [Planctomycetota bacterium]|jgi:nucleoid-associated protein YgaU